jgi:hypothetical protein
MKLTGIICLFPLYALFGCLSDNGKSFSCDEQGIVNDGGSNWVFGIDTVSYFRFATKYPIHIKTEIFDDHLDLINSFDLETDSAIYSTLPHYRDSFRLLKIAWFGTKSDGKPAEPGCYEAKFSIQALPNALGGMDVPSDPKKAVVIEFHFTLARG